VQDPIELAISENGILSKVDLDEIGLISDTEADFIKNLIKNLAKVSDISKSHENNDQSLSESHENNEFLKNDQFMSESHENDQFLKVQSVQGYFGEFDNIT